MTRYNPHDWTGHLCDIRGSMLRAVASRVFLVALWAGGMFAFDHYVHTVRISPLGHTLVGVALGLLLVVRTNASYDRFWEARRLWGGMINAGANLSRVAATWLAAEPDLVRRINGAVSAFCRSAVSHLRRAPTASETACATAVVAPAPTPGTGPSVAACAVPTQAGAADAEAFPSPQAAARRLGELFFDASRRGVFSERLVPSAERYISEMTDCVGACERIRTTPLPLAYVIHLRRSVILYLISLPAALLNEMGWMAIPAVTAMSFILLGIEEIGVEIEDPFGTDDNDLPLERFCGALEESLSRPTEGPSR